MDNVEAPKDDQEYNVLKRMRENDQLTDFTICVDEERMRVHKVVLAANSDFFKSMLTSNSSERNDNQVKLQDIDSETVKIIVDFWYTNKMAMTSTNISSLLLAASRFQSKTALGECEEFARSNLTANNCLSIAVVCERCNLKKLGDKAFDRCLEHFEDIVQGEEFLSLDEEFFTKIISNDRLIAGNEINVFEAIIKWVQFDEKLRSSRLKQLMREVRFASIDPVRLLKPSIRDLAKISEDYRDVIIEAMTILLLKNKPELCEEYFGKFKREPRKSIVSNQRLFVFGGESQNSSALVHEVYHPGLDVWSTCVSKPKLPVGLAAPLSKNSIYTLSADRDQKPQYYDACADEWTSGERLFDGPESGYLVVIAGSIYSFGKSSNGYINSLTRYDLTTKSWFKCASLLELREDPGFAVHDHYIYVMGGSKIGSKDAMVSVERYDSKEDSWQTRTSMRRPRKLFGSCYCKGEIYVAGGLNCGSYMNEAEKYNPKLDSWTEIEPMSMARGGAGLVEFLGQVYAVGGHYDHHQTRNSVITVEAYDPDSRKWSKKKFMNGARSKPFLFVREVQ